MTEFVLTHSDPERVTWKFIYLSGYKEWIEFDPEIDSGDVQEWWLPYTHSLAHLSYYIKSIRIRILRRMDELGEDNISTK